MGVNDAAVKVWESRFQTILLSICTAFLIGGFTFLWDMNKENGKEEVRDANRDAKIEQMLNEFKAKSDRDEARDEKQDKRIETLENERLYRDAENRINRK